MTARPIELIVGYLLSMLPRGHAVRSLDPPLIPRRDSLFFPGTIASALQEVANALKPDRPIYQPIAVRVLTVTEDGFGLLQQRKKGPNQGYGDSLDVTGAGYIDAGKDVWGDPDEFRRAIKGEDGAAARLWPVGVDRAMRRELTEEVRATGDLARLIWTELAHLSLDAFRCFGLDRDLRHNHRSLIGCCQIPVQISSWLGRRVNVNGEECYELRGHDPTNPFVNRLVAIDLKKPLSPEPVVTSQLTDRWVHSGLLTAMLTQDYYYPRGGVGTLFEPEALPVLSEGRLRSG
jgi:hypothetical protein